MKITFLGTGGGRWMTITQRLHTGGFRIEDDVNLQIDPGAGALARAVQSRINPLKTDGVLVSHCHPDHYSDTEVFIEAMTKGMTRKKGVLGASESVIHGSGDLGPAVSKYHRSKVGKEYSLTPGDSFKIGEMGVKAIPTVHSDPYGVGFKLYTNKGLVVYTGDTEYFDGMTDHYQDASLLILNMIRPLDQRLKWHLCGDEAINILKESRPKTAIITHFGMKMVPLFRKEAQRIESSSGVRTIAARDGMKFQL